MSFQSHAGSIEAGGDPGGGPREERRFQSHAGSIEAVRRDGDLGEIRRFNPTLVRLRLSRLAG